MPTDPCPRISIVTPTLNQAAFVGWTVRSVFGQRYPNLEYIVLDAGSTDGTVEQIARYVPRLTYFRSEPDDGQAAAIAEGFERSTGEIMAYLNSDDVLLPGALAFVAEYFAEHPDVDCLYGHRAIIDENNIVTGHWILPRHHNFLMERDDFIPQEATFWRRSLFERGGNIDPGYQFAMDYDLFVRYMRKGRFRRVNRFLAAYRSHRASKSTLFYETIGAKEIGLVRERYRIAPYSRALRKVLDRLVRRRSAAFILSGKRFPGLPSGVGYSLNRVWGGLLESAEPI
ncbi:MAG TPA: glycosyltransferase family 2 protein [Bauldia sp.]|nr:glycosyltransferase family 2 protein [Bauldia sp.]